MQNLRKIILAFIALAILMFGYFMMKYLSGLKKDPPKRPPVEAVRFVKTEPVKNATVKTVIEGSGRVLTGQKVSLIAEVQGKLMNGDIPLKEGQSFRQGQRLYQIDSKEAAYTLAAQKSQFMTNLAAILPDIKLDYPNYFEQSRNYFNGININGEMDELFEIKDNAFKTFLASKNVLNQYYSIKSAEERLKKYTFHAPFSGTFSNVLLQTGSVVNPGTNIAQIINTEAYEVEVPIAAGEISWVKNNADVQLVNRDSGKKWDGKVTRIGEYLDPNTQSINVYVTIKGDASAVYDGMYLIANIPGPDVVNAFEIPRKALHQRDKVFTVVEGKLSTSAVEVKKLNTETAVIAGLKDGEIVVTEAVVNSYENMPVRIMDEISETE